MSADAWEREWTPVLQAVAEELRDDGSLRERRIGVSGPTALAAALAEAGADVVPDGARAELVVGSGVAVGAASLGASEGTPTGVAALRSLHAGGSLAIPCVATAEAACVARAAGEAAIGRIVDATNLLVAGKRVAVLGYGRTGRAVAASARGMHAEVLVAAGDPLAALAAHEDGHTLVPAAAACAAADVVLPCDEPLPPQPRFRDGALLADGGAGLDTATLASQRSRVRERVEELAVGDVRVYVVDGDGTDLLDASDTLLAAHLLAARHLVLAGRELDAGVHSFPRDLDERLARLKLRALGLST